MPATIELSQADKVALASGYNSAFYQALLNLMEAECQKAETAHFRLGPDKPDAEIRASLGEVRAMRIFFEKVQLVVSEQLALFLQEQEANRVEKEKQHLTPEQKAYQALTTPIPANIDEVLSTRVRQA